MTCILSLETSTPVCSVALHRDGQLTGLFEVHVEKSHSEVITLLIDHVLEYTGTERGQIDAVAVSGGPGSYTGLRIGVSTAKGLCYGLGIPLVAVNTLQGMAKGINRFNHMNCLLCPMLDARRMEVYTAVADVSGTWVWPPRPLVVEVDSFDNLLNEQKVWFFGNGMPKVRELIGKKENTVFADGVEPSAAFVGEVAEEKFKREETEDLAYFEPFYLKEFRATKPKKMI